MKHVSTLLFAFLLSLPSIAQQALPDPTPESVNLRLELAASEFDKAASVRETALYVALFGGAITALAFESNDRDGRMSALLTIGATYGLMLKAGSHSRRGNNALRHQ